MCRRFACLEVWSISRARLVPAEARGGLWILGGGVTVFRETVCGRWGMKPGQLRKEAVMLLTAAPPLSPAPVQEFLTFLLIQSIAFHVANGVNNRGSDQKSKIKTCRFVGEEARRHTVSSERIWGK